MCHESRQGRLAAELQALQAIQSDSSLLDFECYGDPPDRYSLLFRGRGVLHASRDTSCLQCTDRHRVALRLPAGFPRHAPEIVWQSPIWLLSPGSGGTVTLAEIGLHWHCELGLDLICERLWDVARGAYIGPAQSNRRHPGMIFAPRHRQRLPVDPRPLRDRLPVERYSRYRPRTATREVLYIC